ncbi:MAG: DUF4126 domain-containing protein [Steroidobacteraceae bacterium]
MDPIQVLLSVALGVGLAAATGLRVFLPLFALSIAAASGHVTLAPAFAWLGSTPALVMLGVATLAEVLAYYIPGVDHALDVLAAPAALIAGTLATAAVVSDLPPVVRWTTAVIAGGGAAGLTQGLTTLLRLKSAALSGGLGNPVVASAELGGAVLLSVLALLAPVIALALAVALGAWLLRRLARRGGRGTAPPRPPAQPPATPPPAGAG